MIGKKFDSISVEDFQSLIDNEVSEGRTIEYKSELNIDSGDERRSSWPMFLHLPIPMEEI